MEGTASFHAECFIEQQGNVNIAYKQSIPPLPGYQSSSNHYYFCVHIRKINFATVIIISGYSVNKHMNYFRVNDG